MVNYWSTGTHLFLSRRRLRHRRGRLLRHVMHLALHLLQAGLQPAQRRHLLFHLVPQRRCSRVVVVRAGGLLLREHPVVFHLLHVALQLDLRLLQLGLQLFVLRHQHLHPVLQALLQAGALLLAQLVRLLHALLRASQLVDLLLKVHHPPRVSKPQLLRLLLQLLDLLRLVRPHLRVLRRQVGVLGLHLLQRRRRVLQLPHHLPHLRRALLHLRLGGLQPLHLAVGLR
mmetsp:Transcript_26101/g.65647  ORF Transcript_26101/g.65647 Transcript_26101/m.65647 type:complete len:228 (-) Transcript_26101:391-1074(-)